MATKRFNAAWDKLADAGWCDSRGHQEYKRVRGEWVAAGQPKPIKSFIRWRANVGPYDLWSPGDPLRTEEIDVLLAEMPVVNHTLRPGRALVIQLMSQGDPRMAAALGHTGDGDYDTERAAALGYCKRGDYDAMRAMLRSDGVPADQIESFVAEAMSPSFAGIEWDPVTGRRREEAPAMAPMEPGTFCMERDPDTGIVSMVAPDGTLLGHSGGPVSHEEYRDLIAKLDAIPGSRPTLH